MRSSILKSFLVFLLIIAVVIVGAVNILGIKLPKVSLPVFTEKKTESPEIKSIDGQIEITFADFEKHLDVCCSNYLKKLEISKKDESSIAISGKTVNPFETDVRLDLELSVKEGKIILKVTNAKMGKIESPDFLTKPLNLAL
ncbi:hypothetical protein M1146_04940, partial [Patescibacteria group bacterium]|nr:hypothetical protein [Patescibacteria group bacterium]